MDTDTSIQTDDLPDLPGIDIQAGLEITRNNVQLYRRLLLKFLEGKQAYIDQFAEARNQQDYLAISEVAHSLKGVTANLGITSVYDVVISLETACKGEADNISTLLDTVITRLDTACNSITVLQDDNN